VAYQENATTAAAAAFETAFSMTEYNKEKDGRKERNMVNNEMHAQAFMHCSWTRA